MRIGHKVKKTDDLRLNGLGDSTDLVNLLNWRVIILGQLYTTVCAEDIP
jgi:hypothetical protein